MPWQLPHQPQAAALGTDSRIFYNNPKNATGSGKARGTAAYSTKAHRDVGCRCSRLQPAHGADEMRTMAVLPHEDVGGAVEVELRDHNRSRSSEAPVVLDLNQGPRYRALFMLLVKCPDRDRN